MFNHSVFKSLLFFGAGAVLDATGERDMEHLGGLIHRMPQTAFVFLVGCVAISALPPLNGFVSEWLTFQAILLSPQLPSWGLKFLVPAVGALLALSAALAAACFVKAFGITFLGRAAHARGRARAGNRPAARSRRCIFLRRALPGRRHPARLLHRRAGAGDRRAWSAAACRCRAASNGCRSCRSPRAAAPTTACWCSCSSRSRASLAAFAIHRLASDRLRRGPAWDCGYPDPSPATQYTADSFAQPIRRVFGTVVFRAREHVEMPPPGDTRPARLTVDLRDLDLGRALCADRRRRRASPPTRLNHLQFLTIRQYLSLVFARAGAAAPGARDMAVILDLAVQGAQMLLVLLLAPLLTGFVRKVKARLLRRQGPPLLQPYRDLVRLMRKEVVLAENASWLFRVIPYLVFAATWVAASLVPTFRSGLLFSWSADLIAIIALLGSARFFLALAGLDVGTSFGGIGSSREVMIASLAEPAMLMIVFTLALIAGSTQLSTMAAFMALARGGPARVARAGAGRADHGGDRRERAHSGRQSGDPSRAHHGARGHGAGIFRPPSRADRPRRVAQAPALRLADRLPVRALGHGRAGRRSRRRSPSASPPISASSPSAASCWRCSRPRSPRCGCSACRSSSAPR